MLWFALYSVLGVVGIIGLSAALVGLVAELPRARRAARIALGAGAFALLLGFGSSAVALTRSFPVVAASAPKEKAAILGAAIDTAMRSTWLGLAVSFLILPLAAGALLRVSVLGKR